MYGRTRHVDPQVLARHGEDLFFQRQHSGRSVRRSESPDFMHWEPERGELVLTRTTKVSRQVKGWSPRTDLVGFKREVGKSDERLREIGVASLRENRADLVVANDLTAIRDEQHPAIIVGRGGNVLATPQTKSEIARELCRLLALALR